MNWQILKETSRRLTIEVFVAVLLAGFKADLPEHISYGQAWQFVFEHPQLVLHILVGTVVLVEAAVLFIRMVMAKHGVDIALSAVGLASVVVAYITGERYVATQSLVYMHYMGDVGAVALFWYAIVWYWSHRKVKNEAAAAEPGGDKTDE